MSYSDSYVTCPFEKSHRILESRLAIHIAKCRKNYPQDHKLTCYFNATHLVDPEEYEHHISVCPSSGNLMCYQLALEEKKRVGVLSLEEVANIPTTTLDEDWSGNTPSYNPIAATQDRNIIRTASCLPKSKKKLFKMQERERIAAIEHNRDRNGESSPKIQPKTVCLEQPLRAPKKAAKALKYSQDSSISDIASKLEDVSINEYNASMKENISITSNYDCKDTTFFANTSKHHTSNTFTFASCSNNIIGEKQKENISHGKSNPDMKSKNISKANENASKDISISKLNNLKKKKDTSLQTNSVQQNSENLHNLKPLNPRIAAKFYDEARKISTGRGFTIAYKYLHNNISKLDDKEESPEDLSSAYGYNDD